MSRKSWIFAGVLISAIALIYIIGNYLFDHFADEWMKGYMGE